MALSANILYYRRTLGHMEPVVCGQQPRVKVMVNSHVTVATCNMLGRMIKNKNAENLPIFAHSGTYLPSLALILYKVQCKSKFRACWRCGTRGSSSSHHGGTFLEAFSRAPAHARKWNMAHDDATRPTQAIILLQLTQQKLNLPGQSKRPNSMTHTW